MEKIYEIFDYEKYSYCFVKHVGLGNFSPVYRKES